MLPQQGSKENMKKTLIQGTLLMDGPFLRHVLTPSLRRLNSHKDQSAKNRQFDGTSEP